MWNQYSLTRTRHKRKSRDGLPFSKKRAVLPWVFSLLNSRQMWHNHDTSERWFIVHSINVVAEETLWLDWRYLTDGVPYVGLCAILYFFFIEGSGVIKSSTMPGNINIVLVFLNNTKGVHYTAFGRKRGIFEEFYERMIYFPRYITMIHLPPLHKAFSPHLWP